MQIRKYPDNTSYAVVERLDSTVFTFRVNSYEDLWHLNQVVEAFNRVNLTPTVTIPWLIDAQADRNFGNDFTEFQSSGLKLVCRFLNQMDAKFKIFHPHNPEVVEALLDNVKILNNDALVQSAVNNIFTKRVPESVGYCIRKNLVLMSSDAGGFKPLMKTCERIGWQGETFSASKSREYKDEESILTQKIDREDFQGKDILIIDDISVRGGTFKGLSKLLRERNCGKLYLAVSHMTLANLGDDPVTNYFDQVFTTNSKGYEYLAYNQKGHDRHHGMTPSNLSVINLF